MIHLQVMNVLNIWGVIKVNITQLTILVMHMQLSLFSWHLHLSYQDLEESSPLPSCNTTCNYKTYVHVHMFYHSIWNFTSCRAIFGNVTPLEWITTIGGVEQFTAWLVLFLVDGLFGAGVLHVLFFFQFEDIFALATWLLGCDCFLPSFILHDKFLQTTVLQYHHFTVCHCFCLNFLSEIENSESSHKYCFWWQPFCL